MKQITFIITLLLLTSCRKDAQQVEQTSNQNVNVELLFEKDGCKIYRFEDSGHTIYWTDCRGKTEYVYTYSSGKSAHTVRIQNETVTKEDSLEIVKQPN